MQPLLLPPALLCVWLEAVAALNPALLPAGPQNTAPPPQDALQYLETGGGAVAVSDLGGAAPWLRELHRRAAAPVLLWRGPAQPVTGVAPYWLEGAPAYLLVARSPQRLLGFIDTDTADALVFDRLLKAEGNNTVLNLELSSSAPLVLTVESLTLSRAAVSRLLTTLWVRHQQFRGLLLSPAPAGDWDRRYLDPFARPGLVSWRPSLRGYALLRPPAGASGSQLKALLGQRAFDLGGAPLRVVWLRGGVSSEYAELELWGQTLLHKGRYLRLLDELARLLHFEPQQPDGPAGEDWGERTGRLPCVESCQLIMKRLADYTLHFCSSDGLSTLVTGHKQMCIEVPRAPLMPAWSLLLRAFGPRLWALWAATALGYTLGWRVLAGDPLAASLAAALRALSSCGGPPQGRVSDDAQRLQLAAALLGSAVILCTLYQGRLYELMVQPQRAGEVNSLQQLAAANVTLLKVQAELFTPLEEAPEWHSWRPQEHVRVRAVRGELPELVAALRAAGPGHGLLLDCDRMRQLRICNRADFEQLRPMDQPPPLPAAAVRISHRNCPWREALNRAQLRVSAAGLLRRWDWEDDWLVEQLARAQPEMYRVLPTADRVAAARALNLPQLQAGFQLLAAGLAMAVVAAVTERHCVHRRRQCQVPEPASLQPRVAA